MPSLGQMQGQVAAAGAGGPGVDVDQVAALFFPAFFRGDSINRMTEPEVATVTSFLLNAPNGPVYPCHR